MIESRHHQLVEVAVHMAFVHAGRFAVFVRAGHRLVLVIGHHIMEIGLRRRADQKDQEEQDCN